MIYKRFCGLSLFRMWFIVILFHPIFSGCNEVMKMPSQILKKSFHQKFDWTAEVFFDDPSVIELCRAIEASDIERMRELIADGVDVNALGRDSMTPLLWAFPDGKLERFELLLQSGADPNVKFTGNFGVPSAFLAGDSVTILAAETYFPGYFEAVLHNGGNPRQKSHLNEPLLHVLIAGGRPNRSVRINLLLDAGADINELGYTGWPATITAIGWFQQYDIALELLEAGADPSIYRANSNSKLIHAVVKAKHGLSTLSPKQHLDHARLLEWLVNHGEDAVQAQKDLDRWASWRGSPAYVGARRRAEIADRLHREQAKQDGEVKHAQ